MKAKKIAAFFLPACFLGLVACQNQDNPSGSNPSSVTSQTSIVIEEEDPLKILGKEQCYFDLPRPSLVSISIGDSKITASGPASIDSKKEWDVEFSKESTYAFILFGTTIKDGKLEMYFNSNYGREDFEESWLDSFGEWRKMERTFFYVGDTVDGWDKSISESLNRCINENLRPGAGR